ncbi:MAG: oligosaccharide flippase family protein [Rhodobacteraceae bacterium]|nr:oligosaccharide flippase family protein [Paracoccaceae bacterium]
MTEQPKSAQAAPRKLGDAMLATSFSSGLIVIVTLLTGIVLAPALGPEGRGDYGSLQFLAQFGITIFSFSFFDALVIRLRARGDIGRKAMSLMLIIVLALFAGVMLVFFGGAKTGLLEAGRLNIEMPFLCLTLLIGVGMLNHGFVAIETSSLEFRRINLERVASPTLFLVSIVVMAALGEATPFRAVLAFFVTKLPVAVLRLVDFRRTIFGPINPALAAEVSRLGPKLHLSVAALALASQADRLIIVCLWPADWVGFYFVAFTAAGVGLTLVVQAINLTLLPTLSGLAIAEQSSKVERLFRLGLTSGLCVALAMWVLAPVLVPLVYGQDFAPAAGFVRGLLFSMLLMPVLSIVNIANKARERSWPGIEMALVSVSVFAVGYALSGYTQPWTLFTAMALANIASLLAGLRHLVRAGVVTSVGKLVPEWADFVFLMQTGWRFFGAAWRRVKR